MSFKIGCGYLLCLQKKDPLHVFNCKESFFNWCIFYCTVTSNVAVISVSPPASSRPVLGFFGS